MEKIESFVARTRGPMIPFVAEWYPWAYAHHYLRIEMERVPTELDRPARSLSLDSAMGLVHRWCAVTGEEAEEAARQLADAYLERWGVVPPDLDEWWAGATRSSQVEEEQHWSGPADDEQCWSETADQQEWLETAEEERRWAEIADHERPQSRVEPAPEPLPEPRLAPRPDVRPEARFEPRVLALLPASGVAVLRETLAGEPTLILPAVSDEVQDVDSPQRSSRAQLTTGH
jgi:hypothetical protein